MLRPVTFVSIVWWSFSVTVFDYYSWSLTFSRSRSLRSRSSLSSHEAYASLLSNSSFKSRYLYNSATSLLLLDLNLRISFSWLRCKWRVAFSCLVRSVLRFEILTLRSTDAKDPLRRELPGISLASELRPNVWYGGIGYFRSVSPPLWSRPPRDLAAELAMPLFWRSGDWFLLTLATACPVSLISLMILLIWLLLLLLCSPGLADWILFFLRMDFFFNYSCCCGLLFLSLAPWFWKSASACSLSGRFYPNAITNWWPRQISVTFFSSSERTLVGALL